MGVDTCEHVFPACYKRPPGDHTRSGEAPLGVRLHAEPDGDGIPGRAEQIVEDIRAPDAEDGLGLTAARASA